MTETQSFFDQYNKSRAIVAGLCSLSMPHALASISTAMSLYPELSKAVHDACRGVSSPLTESIAKDNEEAKIHSNLIHRAAKIRVTSNAGTPKIKERRTRADMTDYFVKPYPYLEVVEAFLHNRHFVDQYYTHFQNDDHYTRLVDYRMLRLSGPRQSGKSAAAEITIHSGDSTYLISALDCRGNTIVPENRILYIGNNEEFTNGIKHATVIVIDQQGIRSASGKLYKRFLKRFKENPSDFHPDLRLIVID